MHKIERRVEQNQIGTICSLASVHLNLGENISVPFVNGCVPSVIQVPACNLVVLEPAGLIRRNKRDPDS